MKTKFINILVVGFVSSLLLGCASNGNTNRSQESSEKARMLAFSHAQGEALSARIVLEELRGNRTATAVESLEFQLDSAVCRIWSQLDKVDSSSKGQALNVLRSIKKYRQQYPREKGTQILDPNGALGLEAAKITSQADAVLKNLK